jgi:acyl dehydratase
MRYFDDFVLGEQFELGSYTFTAERIKTFAAKFDPQPFHLDEAAAARSHFGGLCASGWQTASVWMRLITDHIRAEDDARRVRGEASGQLGLSPGFRELKWLKPVYVNDTISYGSEAVMLRKSASRPDWGLMSLHNTGSNQRGELVISFTSTVFVECRPAHK